MKRKLNMLVMFIVFAVFLASCGQKNNGGGENVPPAGFEDVEDKEETEDIKADTGETGESRPLEERDFTKSVWQKDLEKELTAWVFEYDESEDSLDDHSIDQVRDRLHMHLNVLEPGEDWEECAKQFHEENYHNVSTVWSMYGIQQASMSNSDGTAVFAVTRAMPFEDGDEGDYDYYGVLVFTDGTSSAHMRLQYDLSPMFDEEGRTKADVTALLAKYGIDYESLSWTDMESKPAENEVVYEETQMLTWADKNVSYGPVKTFKLALTTNNETSVVTQHDSGVTLSYELTDDGGTVEELLQADIEGAKRIAETVEEGTGFNASPITTAADGTVYSSYTYTDKDGNNISGTYAYRVSGTEGVRVRLRIYMNPIWGYEEGEEEIYYKVISDFGLTN